MMVKPNLLIRIGIIISLCAIFAIFFYSVLFIVPSGREAIIARYGSEIRRVGPGLKIKAPFGIDMVYLLPEEVLISLDFGSIKTVSKDRVPFELTANAEFNIYDMNKYLLSEENVNEALRTMSAEALAKSVWEADSRAIYSGRNNIIDVLAEKKLEERPELSNLGVELKEISVTHKSPYPQKLVESFETLENSRIAKRNMLEKAQNEYLYYVNNPSTANE